MIVEKVKYEVGVGEKILQRNMLKADLVSYYSQIHSFPWDFIARRTCGITAASMAVSLKNSAVKPFDVLEEACNLHRVPGNSENFFLKVVGGNGKEILVPVGMSVGNDVEKALSDDPLIKLSEKGGNVGEYRPVFSLNGGYDHRGSKDLFAQFGMRAEKLGEPKNKLKELDLVDRLKSGAVFMASVKNSITPWLNFSGSGPASHIVLLTDVVNFSGEDWYYVVDPYSPTNSRAVFLQPTVGFHDIEFNGYGTIVYIDGKNAK